MLKCHKWMRVIYENFLSRFVNIIRRCKDSETMANEKWP